MPTIESIGNLELLVKLASFGTAGISLLAVVVLGIIFVKLPNDTSNNKTSLLKFFMGMVIFLTIVCGVTSWANARFTQNKVVEANRNFIELGKAYTAELIKVEQEKSKIEASLNKIRNLLVATPTHGQIENINNSIVNTRTNLTNFHMTPYDIIRNKITGQTK